MGLSIKRIDTERKARAVAERMGVGVTEAIDRALDRAWQELTAEDQATERARKRKALFAYFDSLPKAGGPSFADIENDMYGEGGEPI